ncbi:hemolysin D [Bradyrhizobium sp. USDA 4524]|uniref:HlyD family type I secretion periplasmic adaptor subunit n=1 Tax=unclassified Bradyrhizobium TaxID=2631580 RepID=UPI00209E7DB3|nr:MULTISPECIES: HlyD family type I secretion periplasmic adaptor subunit [unclassified Bradyrhizobium]MCP1845513.1 hemolysin D [Bradyrhizobium sp. USDA 4538]MCP1907165.1 hemolysin D [Bradyrhizobium sp. USDA 4537]MCP1985641.1 hemolysin D [Bradyrhizobium sp. USDA 4539]
MSLPGKRTPRLPKPTRSDQEFLPAALEILEIAPSPVGVALMWIICTLATCVLVWSYVSRIDVIATAQGKIQPVGHVKIIQPSEPGRIVAIHVQNGQLVTEGQELIGLESGEADADVNELRARLQALRGEAIRRNAALRAVEARRLASPAIDWDEVIPREVREREALVLEAVLNQLKAKTAELEAEKRQKQLERDLYAATSDALETLAATLQERVDMRASLARTGSGSKADLIDSLERLQDQKAKLATARGQFSETEAAIDVLSQRIESGYSDFTADNLQKLAEAEREIDGITQRIAKARVRQQRMVLKSPIAGRVSAMSVTTFGQVVSTGEELMRIVPDAGSLEIECYIANRDIGFVHPGQAAAIKIESLPFTRYGTIDATLLSIQHDAIPEPDATQAEGNPIRSLDNRGFAGAQRTQNLVFPATLRPEVTRVIADGAPVPLSPGMAVKVEIKTGSRRVLDYVFSPLVEITSQAFKER